jgi:hypothetical protein
MLICFFPLFLTCQSYVVISVVILIAVIVLIGVITNISLILYNPDATVCTLFLVLY